MSRSAQRLLFNFAAIGFGLYLWQRYDTINGAPSWIFSSMIGGTGVLGLLGFNVFVGGPLDKNND